MLVRRSSDLKYSDVTPRNVYMNRRKFLQAMGITAGAALAGKTALDMVSPSRARYSPRASLMAWSRVPFNATDKVSRASRDHLQQLLRIRHR